MILKNISRRDFIKSAFVGFFLTKTPAQPDFSVHENNDFSMTVDGDYVVINGWILLKSDVEIE